MPKKRSQGKRKLKAQKGKWTIRDIPRQIAENADLIGNIVGVVNNMRTPAAPSAVLTSENRVVDTYRPKKSRKKVKRQRSTKKLVKRIKDFNAPQRVFNFVTTYTAECAYGYSRYSAMLMGTFADNVYKNTLYEVGNKLVNYGTNALKFTLGGFHVDNMHLRTVIRNITQTPEGPGNWTGTLDIDVYHVECRRHVFAEELSGDVETMLAGWKNYQNQAKAIDGVNDVTYAGAGIAMAQQNAGLTAATQAVGDTLFDNGLFCKYFKITRVQKVQLPVGETFEINMHHGRDYYVPHCQTQEIVGASLNKSLFARRGVTKGFILNTNGRLYTNALPQTNFALGTLQIENYVRYSVKPITTVDNAAPTLDYKQTII